MDKNVLTFNQESDKYFLNRPRYPLELYRLTRDNCRKRDTAWDCACGNGQVSIDLIPYFSKIEATDINENQLKNSFNDSRISYSLQNSEVTNFPALYFDAVCVAQALHWLDTEKYFAEVKRVLKPGGLFACWGYSFFHVNEEIDTVIRSRLLERIDPYWSAQNRILHNRYRDIAFPFRKLNLPEIKMAVQWNLNQLLAYLETWSAVKLYREKEQKNIIEELRPLLLQKWDSNENREISMDFFYYMGIIY